MEFSSGMTVDLTQRFFYMTCVFSFYSFALHSLLCKEREAPNPQTLGCARDALSGA